METLTHGDGADKYVAPLAIRHQHARHASPRGHRRSRNYLLSSIWASRVRWDPGGQYRVSWSTKTMCEGRCTDLEMAHDFQSNFHLYGTPLRSGHYLYYQQRHLSKST